jgi:hypothetical protein
MSSAQPVFVRLGAARVKTRPDYEIPASARSYPGNWMNFGMHNIHRHMSRVGHVPVQSNFLHAKLAHETSCWQQSY